MFRSNLLLLFLTLTLSLSAQHLDKEFHKQRRQELRKMLPPASVAIFFAAEEKVRSNDINYPFHQDPDFYYLTGYNEPLGALLIFKDSIEVGESSKFTNEIILVRSRDKQQELWNGSRLGVEGVQSKLGFQFVFHFEDSRNIIPLLRLESLNTLYIEGENRPSIQKYYADNKVERAKISTVKLNDLMNQLRETKTPLEIEMVKRAVQISCIGQVETMKTLTPEMTEMEAQGIHEFVFKKYGCQEVGYPSIVGAGNNSCVLHYIKSEKDLKDGELILMDVGAEYEGYSADVTRTIPVNGKFSKEQAILYNIVKKAQEAAFEECKVGNDFKSTNRVARKIITQELYKLGILKDTTQSRKYFPHGTSHYLGLDVHDRGTYGVFKPNTIITVEPGIYIPEGSDCDKKWWGIGIRIEDDILITEVGWINLSESAPRTIEEIEHLMKKKSPLNEFVLPLLKPD